MLVGKLFAGSVDVVGDVHGEIEVLEALLERLGYDGQGRHPQGRRLVFVGDLIDRGPDSLAVVSRVRELIEAERAQCVIGNHELNALRHDRKEGNDWFFDEIDAAEQARICAFLGTLPLALEREDLRVVHACWEDAAVARLRTEAGHVVELSQRFAAEIDDQLERTGVLGDAALDERVDLSAPERKPPMLSAIAERNVRRQVAHPVKVLTSGLEAVAGAPFWAGGKWRFEQRVPWWETYSGPMVVVGHYWRSRRPEVDHGKGVDLFAGVAPESPLGPSGRVMCVDYSIGKRSEERKGGSRDFETQLAAYRWPEAVVEFAPA